MSEMVTYKDSELQFKSQLILCIEECDNLRDDNVIDNRIFIGYGSFDEHGQERYFLRGKRNDTLHTEYVPYSFYCKRAHHVYEFLRGIFDSENKIVVTLYNYNNLTNDENDNELSFEFFESNMDPNYEIVAFDNSGLTRKPIMRYLSILQNTFNCYPE
jgi:hypothetical protein